MSKDEYLITDAPLKALTVFAMPMILGSFNFWQMAPIASPTRKINANDVNISTTFFLKIQFTRSVSLSSM